MFPFLPRARQEVAHCRQVNSGGNVDADVLAIRSLVIAAQLDEPVQNASGFLRLICWWLKDEANSPVAGLADDADELRETAFFKGTCLNNVFA